MRKKISWGIILAIILSFNTPAISHAAETELAQGMTQGQFALWLVKVIGALENLPPAADEQDAIEFFERLGIVPEGGWDRDAELTREVLASLLDDPEEGAGLSFEELAQKVAGYVQGIFNSLEPETGNFRVMGGGGSGTVPPA